MPQPHTVSLADYTTLQIGGTAELVSVKSVAELRAVREIAQQFPAPPLLLGGGSNLLVSDTGYAGLVIKNDIIGRRYEEGEAVVLLTCGAGELFDAVVAESCTRGYWGLENLSSIPGSVGATPVQNVGAYGVEVSELITAVAATNMNTGESKTFGKAACQFSYRDSFFKQAAGMDWCITEVTFQLQREPTPRLAYKDLQPLQEESNLTPQRVRDAVVAIRSGKFPDWQQVGTAGSFFKNPIISSEHFQQLKKQYPDVPGHDMGNNLVKVSLGWILDKVCGLRGCCAGPVCLYEKQALVLINTGGATAAEVEQFAKLVADTVQEKTDVSIEWEVQRV